ncbi:hypothetical protein WR25_02225 [Diploscapter pachys]|uniref:Uncharacterized protein n=1 Tax=Diploscapter pachys TaxID=2018661 RepID=A0A2A2K7S6_9BILA|nr:hypothetical protein WR25_02225 [Diploscapter pachys]
MVDEEHPVQMVDLMLHAGGEQAGQLFLMRGAGFVLPADTARCRALHIGILFGDRQAAFVIGAGADREFRRWEELPSRGARSRGVCRQDWGDLAIRRPAVLRAGPGPTCLRRDSRVRRRPAGRARVA